MSETIVVVGGGFSGVITAVHALRQTRAPLTIQIIEPRPQLGAGLAYSTDHPEHRLNVPAHRMVLFDEEPNHFHDWFVGNALHLNDPGCDGGGGNLFAARAVFARYVRNVLERASDAAPHPCRVVHHRARAADIEADSGGGWRVMMDDGTSVVGDDVVVCIGHTSTTAPSPFDRAAISEAGRVVGDPWDAPAIRAFGPDARILILGQGLTMGDVLSTLEVLRHRGPVVAVSRRGLLSRAYADSTKTSVPFDNLPDDTTASAVVAMMRAACADAIRTGNSWNSVIETTREQGAALWCRLAPGEQRQLIRHARVFWDAHRYRMAPQVAGAIERARNEGRLRLVSGRVTGAEPAVAGVDVEIRLRPCDGGAVLRAQFDAIVSCVGPIHDVARIDNPFIRALLQRGLARAHTTGLGFEVDRSNALVGERGPSTGLHAVGPLTRGACGDIVGAPEISRQARFVAAGVLNRLGDLTRRPVAAQKSAHQAA